MHAGVLSFDAFLRLRGTDRRLARLTHDIVLPRARGLEFGPANNPTPLPDGVQVAYIDHALDAYRDLANAAPIDFAWSGSGSLSATVEHMGYDFAIGAQVAQYVPNLLGWFRGIHAVLRPGGVLNLSLPDKRFMFDAARVTSSVAELVEADLLAYDRPSPRQLFAHIYETRDTDANRIWSGFDPATAPRLCGDEALALAHARATEFLEHGYADCHCWVFTPSSLLDVLESATSLGLFPFVMNRVAAAEPGEFEFFVSMRRDAVEDPAALRDLQIGAITHLRKTLERQRRTAALVAST